eukprot:TRINITY_DN6809_c0_g1_i1.p1 TRINITY_DN6809_c0_g1~~TRINITY_DN6809_c0_g1_i1.p1  ORF type:complete len:153 (-),score=23.71 TRINITY_DN6809_c0_g1_i1:92-550(-)
MEIVWSERKRTVLAVWVVLVLLATAFVFALANGAVDYYVLSLLRGEGVSASSFSLHNGISKGTKGIINKARLEHRIHQKKGIIQALNVNKRSILESEQNTEQDLAATTEDLPSMDSVEMTGISTQTEKLKLIRKNRRKLRRNIRRKQSKLGS